MIPPFKPSAAVEWRPKRGWDVVGYSRMPSGLSRVNGFVTSLAADIDDSSLGNAILEAFSRSRELPDEDSLAPTKLYEKLGFKSKSAYLSGAESVMVYLSAPGLAEIIDLDRQGAGFIVPNPMRITEARADRAQPEVLGSAVRAVIDG